MASKSIKTPLMLDHYYHIYNRGNSKERLFLQGEHYEYFLTKYLEIVHPSVSTFAYCLIPNHFHFLIRIDRYDEQSSVKNPSHLFRRFFQQYSVWFNEKEKRKGSLFTKYYRRVNVTEEEYLKRLVYYIHSNPTKHGIEKDFKKYPYSSFSHYCNFEASFLARDEVLGWFNNSITEFMIYHNLYEEETDQGGLFLDDN
jgi:REP element-mobilizing transposase RayT